MACKSHVKCKSFTLTLIFFPHIYIYTQGECKYLSSTLTHSYVNDLGHVSVSVYIKVIYEITLSLGLHSPPNQSFSGICKIKKFD